MFLGLRLNRGIDLFAKGAQQFKEEIGELLDLGLLEQSEKALRLTRKGRLLSNEVFERFISVENIEPKVGSEDAEKTAKPRI